MARLKFKSGILLFIWFVSVNSQFCAVSTLRQVLGVAFPRNRQSHSFNDAVESSLSTSAAQLAPTKAITITDEDINSALDFARVMVSTPRTKVEAHGWRPVLHDSFFSLSKKSGHSAVPAGCSEYLMAGELDDISARVFLQSQIEPAIRRRWDSTLMDIRPVGNALYYRVNWPWPLQDRDYHMLRR